MEDSTIWRNTEINTFEWGSISEEVDSQTFYKYFIYIFFFIYVQYLAKSMSKSLIVLSVNLKLKFCKSKHFVIIILQLLYFLAVPETKLFGLKKKYIFLGIICLYVFSGSQPKVVEPLEPPQQFLSILNIVHLPIKRQPGLNSTFLCFQLNYIRLAPLVIS